MKKVLIADDELLVRVGLKSTINWKENGFVVVGEAKNGKEAIEFFENYDPDILLTDIRMPFVNGLELIQKLKEKKPSLKAVILTHYDDFSYAKEAITLGASEYILKSDLAPENLLKVLKKLSIEIDHENKKVNKISTLNNIKTLSCIVSKEILFRKIITGDYKSQEELVSIISDNAVVFKYDLFIIATAKIYIDELKNTGYDEDKKFLEKTVDNVSRDIFNENYISQFSFVNENHIIYLLNFNKMKNLKDTMQKIINLVVSLKKSIEQFLDIDLTIGLSEIGDSIDKLPELYEQSNISARYSFFEPSGIAVFNKDMMNNVEECPKINVMTLKSYIISFDIQKMDDYINSIFDKLFNLKQVNYVRDVFIDFLSHAKFIVAELNFNSTPALNELKFSYNNFEKLYSFELVKKYIFDIYHELMYYNTDNKSNKYSYIIKKSIEYIKNNYEKNITLAEVAEHVEISKSYLSLLFKQETGINFSTFLTNYRIERSKKLLKESNLKIYEIAEKVGFDNPYYYSKVFKDVAGMTCKEFKKASS